MEDSKIKHLEFLQNIITRMNSNSFQIKGLAITIVSALMAVYASTSNVTFIFIAIMPTVLFWFLDAYYLQQERKFRGIYDNVSGLKDDIEVKPFEMPIHKIDGRKYCYCNIFFSKTIAWLYVVIIVCLITIGVVLKFKECILILKCS